jgi:hypothetical protein
VPPAPVTPHAKPWWIVPLVIIGVVVITFLLLMGMPLGGRDESAPRPAAVPTETIAEGSPVPPPAPAESATIVDVGEEPPPATTTTAAPVIVPPATTTTRAPVIVPPVTTTTAAPPAPRQEPPSSPASNEISESEAISTLRGFLVTRNYYNTAAGCVRVSSRGYRNVGYTLDVHDSCESRHLGRWRVDTKTREVFRQQADGRFLRP